MSEKGSGEGDRIAGPDFRRRARQAGLDLEVWISRGRVAARLAGDLDVQSAPILAAALVAAREQALEPSVLLLLEGLRFADSSGLGVLVAAYKRADSAGGAVALAGVPEFLARTLRVAGLTPLLPAFPDESEAADWLDRKNRTQRGGPGRLRFTGITLA